MSSLYRLEAELSTACQIHGSSFTLWQGLAYEIALKRAGNDCLQRTLRYAIWAVRGGWHRCQFAGYVGSYFADNCRGPRGHRDDHVTMGVPARYGLRWVDLGSVKGARFAEQVDKFKREITTA